jgi:hypothetical protein
LTIDNNYDLNHQFLRYNNDMSLYGTTLKLISENQIKYIGRNTLQYSLFFSGEYNQIIIGMLRKFSVDTIQLLHYQVISQESEGFLRIKKCEGCNLGERNNNKSTSCWISVFKYNSFSIDIVKNNYIKLQMKNG